MRKKKHKPNRLILIAGLMAIYAATVHFFGVWLEYLEAHSLFLWSCFFWKETDFFNYLYAFFVQFFISKYWGALLITLAFAAFFELCYALLKSRKSKTNRRFWICFAAMMVLALGTGVKTYNFDKFQLAEIELEARAERWDRVLELSTDFLERAQKQNRDRDSLYFEVVDYTKFALCITHQLPNRFFDYVKFFDRGVLFPDGSSTKADNFLFYKPKTAYFYYAVGIQNMTVQQSFGAAVLYNYPIWAVETFLKAVKIRDTESFGNVLSERLKSSLFHKNPTSSLCKSQLEFRRTLLPPEDVEIRWRLDRTMYKLFENPNNRYAFEYVMTVALTYKEHEFVAKHIEAMANFDYEFLPKHFEEGILANLFFETDTPPTEKQLYSDTYGGFKLQPESIERIKLFMEMMQTFQNTGMGLSRIEREFGNTYWFHFVFGDITPSQILVENVQIYDKYN